MRTLGVATLVMFFVVAVAISAEGQSELPSPVIGTIEVVANEVFDEPSGGFAAFYRAANKIHISTRERIIRRELLFATGDLVDAERLEQTERNLRALSFLRDARVEAVPVDSDGDGLPDSAAETQQLLDLLLEQGAGPYADPAFRELLSARGRLLTYH